MQVQHDVPLSAHTTLKVGGNARFFVEATSVEELQAALRYAHEQSLPIYILGGGSNVLAPDGGWPGLVIKVGLKGVTHEETEQGHVVVTAAAGESWDALVAYTVERKWWGLENLSAIPGTVGATPVQNVGAYGVEVADLITAVAVIDTATGAEKTLSPTECQFRYRESIFKTEAGRRYLITAVTYQLSKTPAPKLEYKDLATYFAEHAESPTLAAIREAVCAIRAQKFPDLATYGTAGSFFKNPVVSNETYQELTSRYPELPGYPQADGNVKVSLAWLLDRVCGLRGHQEGAVALFEKQPLVLVTRAATTQAEIDQFAKHVASLVLEKTGIEIEREVTQIEIPSV